MDIEQLRKEKYELERAITAMIKNFRLRSGVPITQVSVDIRESTMMGDRIREYEIVNCYVELGI